MSFGNVPPDMLAGAVEKLLAKMDETDLAAFYERELSTMPSDGAHAFVEALFEAFHDRGESSEDAAEAQARRSRVSSGAKRGGCAHCSRMRAAGPISSRRRRRRSSSGVRI